MTTARPGRWETRPGVFAFRHLILGAMQRAGATAPLHGGEARRFFRLDGFDETVYIGLLERHADRRFFAACMGAKARRQLTALDDAIRNLLDQAARLQLAEATATQVELSGTIRDGQITFEQPGDAPILPPHGGYPSKHDGVPYRKSTPGCRTRPLVI